MGNITIIANNFFENASGSIRDDGAQILNQSGNKVVQNGEKGVNYDKNTDRKPPTDIRITKLEGPFDDKGKLTDKIVLGTSYIFKATPTRKPTITELKLLKWAVKLDDTEKQIILGAANYNKLEGDKIILPLILKHTFEKAKVYAFYQKADDGVSVDLSLKKIKLPMLILQSVGRKGKRIKKINGVKVSTNETAVDLLYGDYTEDEIGFKKLRDQIYKEAYDVHKQDGIFDFTAREKEASNKSDKIIAKIRLFSKKKDLELFDIFNNNARSVSRDKLEDNIIRMILKMQNNEGGEYIHTDLTNAVINHENTKVFISQVKNWIIPYLKLDKFKDDIEKLEIKDDSEGIIYHSNFKKLVDKPRFNNYSDTLSGIQIAINDVWSYKISLTKYFLKNNVPHGELHFDFYDHFGLDFPDIEKYDQDIFIAWFILQHFRSYKPFVTRISFTTKF